MKKLISYTLILMIAIPFFMPRVVEGSNSNVSSIEVLMDIMIDKMIDEKDKSDSIIYESVMDARESLTSNPRALVSAYNLLILMEPSLKTKAEELSGKSNDEIKRELEALTTDDALKIDAILDLIASPAATSYSVKSQAKDILNPPPTIPNIPGVPNPSVPLPVPPQPDPNDKDKEDPDKNPAEQITEILSNDKVTQAIEALKLAGNNTKEAQKVKIVLDNNNINMNVGISKEISSKLAKAKMDILIESKSLTYEVPISVLEEALKGESEDSILELGAAIVPVAQIEPYIKDKNIAKLSKVVQFNMTLKDKDGKEIKKVNKFNNKIKIGIEIEAKDGNTDLLGVFYVNEKSGALEFVGGKIKDNKIYMSTDHYSKFAVVEYNKSFSDIENHWSRDYVKSMVAKHVLDGYTDVNLYKPEDKLTRSQFAKMLIETLELEPVTFKDDFKDINTSHWAKDYIATAKQLGIIGGYDDGTFRPDVSITRAEMAVMLTNSLGLKKDANSTTLNQFKDVDKVPAWAVEYMVPVVTEKLLVGSNGVLNPLGNVTRGEAATIIYRVYIGN